mgnify:CR=1 FL=1
MGWQMPTRPVSPFVIDRAAAPGGSQSAISRLGLRLGCVAVLMAILAPLSVPAADPSAELRLSYLYDGRTISLALESGRIAVRLHACL